MSLVASHQSLATIIAAIFLFFTSPAQAFEQKLENPSQESEARELFKHIKCSVCGGQTIYDSKSQLAADLREIVRTKIKAGEGREQIISSLSNEYGDAVVISNHNKIIWVLPIIFFVIATLVMFRKNHKVG